MCYTRTIIHTNVHVPCVEKFQCQIIPVFVIRRNNRLDSTGLMSSPSITRIHNSILPPADLSAHLRHAINHHIPQWSAFQSKSRNLGCMAFADSHALLLSSFKSTTMMSFKHSQRGTKGLVGFLQAQSELRANVSGQSSFTQTRKHVLGYFPFPGTVNLGWGLTWQSLDSLLHLLPQESS